MKGLQRVQFVLVGLLVIVGLVAGTVCTSSPTATPTPAATAQPGATATVTPTPTTETIKLGATSILSGSGAAWGIAHDRGAQLSIDEVNSAGGVKAGGKVYLFKLVSEDNKYSTDGGTAAANKLIFTEKVKFLLGVGTTPVVATLAIAEANKVLFLAGCYTRVVLGPDKPHCFRVNVGTEQFVGPMYTYLRERYPTAKTVSICTPNNITGWEVRDYNLAAYEMVGGFQIAVNEVYEAGTTDFYPLISKMLAAKPDVVDTGAAGPGDQALLIEGLRAQGYNGPIITPTAFDFDTVSGIIGKKPLEGLITAIPDWGQPDVMASFRDVYFNYLQKFGPPFNIIAQFGYDGVRAIAAGMIAANSADHLAVKAAWEAPGFSFTGMYGKSVFGGMGSYGINHQVYSTIYAAEVVKGTSVIKKTLTGAEAEELQKNVFAHLPKK